MVTVCTTNYIHFARALVSSLHQHHRDIPAYVVVADWDGQPLEVADAHILPGDAVGAEYFDYMALKYNATDLCCALKPYAIDHLFQRTRYAKILYLDSDIYIFSPLTTMLNALEQHQFVVTPHALAPVPRPERFWEKPSLGDLAYAGVFNAGVFGLRVSRHTKTFIDTWREMVSAPGAFLVSGQMEQNSFNWISCFAEDVLVLRDPTYNVAYWNLHDRSLRYSALDSGRMSDGWFVDGKPLVIFHFSGFSSDSPYALSKYDSRHSLYMMPSLAYLFEFYASKLRAYGADEIRQQEYRFDRFRSGVPIDERMRDIFKLHETFMWCELSPWTAEGEAHYCQALLLPAPSTGSLLPVLFHRVYCERADLQLAYPESHVWPERLFRWIGACGVYEHGYQQLFDRYRQVLPKHHGAQEIITARRRQPEVFADLPQPLGAGRSQLLRRLEQAGLPELELAVRVTDCEHYVPSLLYLVRRIVEERVDVQRAFPDLLDSQADSFARWLANDGRQDHFLPPHVADLFLAKAEGRALARIFSYLNRTWSLMERWPLALVGEGYSEVAQALLSILAHGMEYDLEDVAMYLWTMQAKPWAGVSLTLELAINARRTPSPLLPEGQEALLRPVLERDSRFREALVEYRSQYPSPPLGEFDRRSTTEPESGPREVSVLRLLDQWVHGNGPISPRSDDDEPSKRPLRQGVNLFGYHKSPIGLGSLTRGLNLALEHSGVCVRKTVLGNVAMDADLAPADFVRTYDRTLDTNIFVSYPHLHEMLLHTQPGTRRRGPKKHCLPGLGAARRPPSMG